MYTKLATLCLSSAVYLTTHLISCLEWPMMAFPSSVQSILTMVRQRFSHHPTLMHAMDEPILHLAAMNIEQHLISPTSLGKIYDYVVYFFWQYPDTAKFCMAIWQILQDKDLILLPFANSASQTLNFTSKMTNCVGKQCQKCSNARCTGSYCYL